MCFCCCLYMMEAANNNISDDNSQLNELIKQNIAMSDQMKKMWETMTQLQSSVDTLQSEKDSLERDINELNSYIRRSNIEIRNVPEDIPDDDLQDYVIKMLSAQEIYLRAPDIEAVHRLGKRERGRTRTVICRFVNRKNAFAAIKYQKDLKNTNHFKDLWITENLCPTHRRIFNILYKHHKKGLIFDVKSRNGLVYAVMNENDERKKIDSVKEAELFVATATYRNAQDNPNTNNLPTFSSTVPTVIQSSVSNPTIITPTAPP